MTRKLLPYWKEKQSGHVITVTSLFGIVGMAFSTTYAATKFAVEGYFESLALELLPFENIKYLIFFNKLVTYHLCWMRRLYCVLLCCIVLYCVVCISSFICIFTCLLHSILVDNESWLIRNVLFLCCLIREWLRESGNLIFDNFHI